MLDYYSISLKEVICVEFRNLAEEFFYKSYELRKNNHQQKLEKSLGGEQFTLLYLKDRGDSVLPSEISEEMDISSARVASILNNLENKGLVQRQIDKEDRRKILVTLTNEGRVKAEEHKEKVIQNITMMLELLGEEDAKAFVRITKKLIDLAPKLVEEC